MVKYWGKGHTKTRLILVIIYYYFSSQIKNNLSYSEHVTRSSPWFYIEAFFIPNPC